MQRSGQRQRKVPTKLADYTSDSHVKINTSWCRICCSTNNKEYTVRSSTLETVDGMPVVPSDLYPGNTVVWLHKETPFKAKILETAAKKGNLHIGKPAILHTKRKYKEDSDSEDDEPPSKLLDYASPESDTSDHNVHMQQSGTHDTGTFHHPILNSSGEFRMNESDNSSTKDYKLKELILSLKKDVKLIKDDIEKQREERKTLVNKIDKTHSLMKYIIAGPRQLPSADDTVQLQEDDITEDKDRKFILENGVNLKNITGKDICKHLCQLMDAVFTKQEMSESCLIKTSLSKSTKHALPEDRVKLIEECIDAKWGKGAWNKNYDKLRISGNQKCLDQVKLIKSSGTTKQAHADL